MTTNTKHGHTHERARVAHTRYFSRDKQEHKKIVTQSDTFPDEGREKNIKAIGFVTKKPTWYNRVEQIYSSIYYLYWKML